MRVFLSFVGVSAFLTATGCQMTTDRTASNPGALPDLPASGDKNLQLNATTLFAHGHLLERQGYFDRAIEQYQKAIERKPDFLSAYNRLGVTLNKAGRHAEASEAFQHALDLDPAQAHVHNNLGFSYYLEGKYDLAARSLERAIEIQPEFTRARMNQALVFAKLNRFDDAYQELLAVSSESEAAYNMGMILADARRFPEAAQYLEAALVAQPDFEQARQQLRTVARMAAEQQHEVAPDRPVDAPAYARNPSDGMTNVQTTSSPPQTMANGTPAANDDASPPSPATAGNTPAAMSPAASNSPSRAPAPTPSRSYASSPAPSSPPPSNSSFLNSMTMPAGIHPAADIRAKYDRPAGVTGGVAPAHVPQPRPANTNTSTSSNTNTNTNSNANTKPNSNTGGSFNQGHNNPGNTSGAPNSGMSPSGSGSRNAAPTPMSPANSNSGNQGGSGSNPNNTTPNGNSSNSGNPGNTGGATPAHGTTANDNPHLGRSTFHPAGSSTPSAMTPVSGNAVAGNTQPAGNSASNSAGSPPINAHTTSREPQPAQAGQMQPMTPVNQPAANPGQGTNPAGQKIDQEQTAESVEALTELQEFVEQASVLASPDQREEFTQFWQNAQMPEANQPGYDFAADPDVNVICDQDIQAIDDLVHGRIDWPTFVLRFQSGQMH